MIFFKRRQKEIEAHIIHQRNIKKIEQATKATQKVNDLLNNGFALKLYRTNRSHYAKH